MRAIAVLRLDSRGKCHPFLPLEAEGGVSGECRSVPLISVACYGDGHKRDDFDDVPSGASPHSPMTSSANLLLRHLNAWADIGSCGMRRGRHLPALKSAGH